MNNHNFRVIPKNYFWLSVEGTDGAGKTSLLKEIERFLYTQRKINFSIIKEFSDSSVGILIKKTIKEKNFFSLGNNFNHSFSETLLLCADFVYQFENILLKYPDKKNIFIFSDRGLHSFLTYQTLRIKYQYNITKPRYLQKWIKNIFQPFGTPDFIILLTSPLSDIKKRIKKRDGYIKTKELRFIDDMQNEYVKIIKKSSIPHIVFKNHSGNFKNVKSEAIEIIKKIIFNKKNINN